MEKLNRNTRKKYYFRDNTLYYKRGSNAPNNKRRVTQMELILVKQHLIPDHELSITINRTVKAIHLIRTKLKNGIYKIDLTINS